MEEIKEMDNNDKRNVHNRIKRKFENHGDKALTGKPTMRCV